MFVPKPRNLAPLAGGDVCIGFAALSTPASLQVPLVARQALLRIAKRLEDLTVASVGLALCSPVMAVAALLIRCTSRGPILFRQKRIGLLGRPFTLLKFRTMRPEAKPVSGLRQATRDDDRITCVGRFLRRTSIDELPQLFNVLRGDMSVVGPRPHAPGTCAGGIPFEHISPQYGARHAVKPGLTGLAQVRGWRGETDTQEKLLHRLECDLEYVGNWTLLGDLEILVRTVGAVTLMTNAY